MKDAIYRKLAIFEVDAETKEWMIRQTYTPAFDRMWLKWSWLFLVALCAMIPTLHFFGPPFCYEVVELKNQRGWHFSSAVYPVADFAEFLRNYSVEISTVYFGAAWIFFWFIRRQCFRLFVNTLYWLNTKYSKKRT